MSGTLWLVFASCSVAFFLAAMGLAWRHHSGPAVGFACSGLAFALVAATGH